MTEATASPTSLTLLIRCDNLDAAPVGFVRLYNVNFAHGFAFLETAIAARHRRRTDCDVEARRLVSHFAVAALRLHRLETKVCSHNLVSINLVEHMGFTLEGRLREAYTCHGERGDMLVFGILESEIGRASCRERV